jgi:hypothetical protein
VVAPVVPVAVVAARRAHAVVRSGLGASADHVVDPGPLAGAAHDVAVDSDLREGERACGQQSHEAHQGDRDGAATRASFVHAANHQFSSRDLPSQSSSAGLPRWARVV